MIDRKTFTTTIDTEVQRKFKGKCAANGILMNEVLETFMKMYIEEKFKVVLELDSSKTIVENKK